MSGGYFDYDQWRISNIADQIERLIENNDSDEIDEYGHRHGYGYSPETIARFREAVATLSRAAKMTQRVDWLISGDDSEKSFHRRWDEEIGQELKDEKEGLQMAESVSRREEVLIRAWDDFREGTGVPEAYMDSPGTDKDCQFYVGFNAAWDALLAEIRSLVADLRTHTEISQRQISGEPWLSAATADAKAIKRLRELVRESGE